MSSSNKKKKSSAKPSASTNAAKTAPKNPVRTVAPAVPETKLDTGEVAKIAMILTLICVITTALLAYTSTLTAGRIAEQAAKAKAEACAAVLPADDYVLLSGSDVYLAVDVSGTDCKPCGAILTTSEKGYGGEVVVMTGIALDGRITGVKVLEHGETPGLGANAAKDNFLSQFVTSAGDVRPASFAVSKDGGEIDAVTAATRSSRAVTKAVNKAVEMFEQLKADGALVLPAGYVPPVLQVSASDVTPSDAPQQPESADPDGNGEIDTQPTIVAGGENNG